MKKTKTFPMYIVAFVAIVCLFIAGMSAQSVPSFAKESIQGEGEFTKATAMVDGVTVPDGAIELVFDNKDASQDQKGEIAQINALVAQNDLGTDVKKALDNIAKEYDKDADSAAMQYAPAFIVELSGVAAEGAKVKFDLKDVPLATVEFALFRADGTNDWTVLYPVNESGANNATAKDGADVIYFNVPGTGAIVFGQYSQAKADEIKAGKSTSILDPSNRYHWTIYVIIALGVIFIILLVALVIVKAKAKKVAAVEAQGEVASSEPEDAPVQQADEENKD